MGSARWGYFLAPVTTLPTRAALWLGALTDLGLGLLWVLTPGLWQEIVHPWDLDAAASGLQAAGVGRLLRALLGLRVARGAGRGAVAHASATSAGGSAVAVLRSRSFWAAALAGAWLLDLPSEALLAWQVGDAGPLARGVHMAAAAWAVVVVTVAVDTAARSFEPGAS